MKRYAGENGKCFATQETLMKQLGIGRQILLKSLKYLSEHNWIEAIGTSKGKTRPIKTYKVNDIWQENITYYEDNRKIPSETAVSFKQEIPSETTRDTVQNDTKIPSETAVEEEPVKEEPIKKNHPDSNPEIAEVINLFKDINPSYKNWFGNKTQRKAAADLLEAHGLEKVKKAVSLVARTNSIPYITSITSPYMLESKWALWKAQVEKKMVEKQTKQVVL